MTEAMPTRRHIIAIGASVVAGPMAACSSESVLNAIVHPQSPIAKVTNFGLQVGVEIELGWSNGKQSAKPSAFAFSSDDQFLAVGFENGSISIYDLMQGVVNHTLTGHNHSISSVEFSGSGTMLVSSCSSGTIKLWDIESASILHSWRDGIFSGTAVGKFSPNGKMLLISSMGMVPETRDTSTGKLIAVYGDELATWGSSFSPNGELVVTGSEWQPYGDRRRPDLSCRTWNTLTGQVSRRFEQANSEFVSPRFSSDGQRLTARDERYNHVIWDSQTSEELAKVKGPRFVDIPFHWDPSCTMIVGSSDHGTIGWFCDFDRQAQMVTLETNFAFAPIISANRKFVLTKHGTHHTKGDLYFSELKSGRLIAMIRTGQSGYSFALISNNSQTIVTSHANGAIHVWSIQV